MLNLSIELAGLVLCGLSILLILVGPKVDSGMERQSIFLSIYVCLFLFAGSNLAGQLMRGHPGAAFRAGLYLSNFLEFLMSCLLLCVMSQYLLSMTDPEGKQKTTRNVMRGLMLAHSALLVVSQFTGLYYIIDEANLYRRSAGYPLSYVFAAVMIGIDVRLLIRHRDRLSLKEAAAFWIYIVVTVTAMILQIFIYGVYFIVFATIIAALVMYIMILTDHTERYYRQQVENTRLKIDIMLGQIQPHFLYNTLGVIRSICDTDMEKVPRAIEDFTSYLRHNMNSLAEENPIPFAEEWKHVLCYVNLQRLRFEDALEMEYDLGCTGFNLPTLTLQPLVENAITYGVRKREDGRGVVTIRTREYADRFEVVVNDNGPGFIVETLAGDRERTNTGIRNVRERLRRVCGGELRIESEPGRGTTATMILPKEGNHADFCAGR